MNIPSKAFHQGKQMSAATSKPASRIAPVWQQEVLRQRGRSWATLYVLILALAFAGSVCAQNATPPPAEVPSLDEMLGGNTDVPAFPESPTPAPTPDPATAPGDAPILPPVNSDTTTPGTTDVPDVPGLPGTDMPIPPVTTTDAVPDIGPSPIDPPINPVLPATTTTTPTTGGSDLALPTTGTLGGLPAPDTSGGAMPREFQGDDVGTVLRLLARQAKVNLVVSENVIGTVTMRLENVTAFEAIKIICTSKNFGLDEIDNVFYVRTEAEKAAEPQEPGSYRFSYAKAEEVAPLLQQELLSKALPTVDKRTNTLFYREVKSNKAIIQGFLQSVDSPTKQVMIEARLVEVTANPRQNYGINWAGVLLNKRIDLYGTGISSGTSSTNSFGSSTTSSSTNSSAGSTALPNIVNPDGSTTTGRSVSGPNSSTTDTSNLSSGTSALAGFAKNIDDEGNFIIDAASGVLQDGGFALNPANLLSTFGGQYAILNVPQLSATLSLLNQDGDAEFLANPRIVTADNMEATIKITRSQPVPQLNFNEQTATAVFGGFTEKEFGNTLVVRPTINKDDYITLSIRPAISNKVGDAVFNFAGATVASPIIDLRQLESNVLIQSGDTLAVGGLLQDEIRKTKTKVPFLGDIPLVGYFFSERVNERTKRDLLIFVTPSIIAENLGTGLEDQMMTGLKNVDEEYADPNGWLNNARGSIRLTPTSDRQLTTRYPKYPVPGGGLSAESYQAPVYPPPPTTKTSTSSGAKKPEKSSR